MNPDYELNWCGWANDNRILCGVTATVREGPVLYGITRLVGVNADGSKLKVLIQNSQAGRAQFQDDILDWTLLKDATHQLRLKSQRVTLLTELEKFLLTNLGAGTLAAEETAPAPSP